MLNPRKTAGDNQVTVKMVKANDNETSDKNHCKFQSTSHQRNTKWFNGKSNKERVWNRFWKVTLILKRRKTTYSRKNELRKAKGKTFLNHNPEDHVLSRF